MRQFRTIISIFVRSFIPVNPWQRPFWTLTSVAPVMGGNKICWRPRTFTCVEKRFFSACNYVWKGVLADVQVQAFPPNVGVVLSEACTPKQPSFFFSKPWLQTQLMYIWSCNDPHSLSIHCTSFNHDPITKLSFRALKSSPSSGMSSSLLI